MLFTVLFHLSKQQLQAPELLFHYLDWFTNWWCVATGCQDKAVIEMVDAILEPLIIVSCKAATLMSYLYLVLVLPDLLYDLLLGLHLFRA